MQQNLTQRLDLLSQGIQWHPELKLVAVVDDQGTVIPIINQTSRSQRARRKRRTRAMPKFLLVLLTFLMDIYEEME